MSASTRLSKTLLGRGALTWAGLEDAAPARLSHVLAQDAARAAAEGTLFDYSLWRHGTAALRREVPSRREDGERVQSIKFAVTMKEPPFY